MSNIDDVRIQNRNAFQLSLLDPEYIDNYLDNQGDATAAVKVKEEETIDVIDEVKSSKEQDESFEPK